jgi:hypothetical protein
MQEMMREQWGGLRLQEPQTTTASMTKEKTMAEPHEETQQEKETRWAAQRVAHETQQKDYRAARARTRGRHWLVVGAIVIIIAVIAAALLL